MKRKRPRGKTTWLSNIDRHQKGKNTSLKEVLRTKCFENKHDWRTLMISRSTYRDSGEDPWAPPWSVVNCEHHSPLHQIMIQCTMRRCKSTFYYNTYGSWAGVFEPRASSWFLYIYATGSPPPRKSTVAHFTPIHQPCIVVLSCQPRPWIY